MGEDCLPIWSHASHPFAKNAKGWGTSLRAKALNILREGCSALFALLFAAIDDDQAHG